MINDYRQLTKNIAAYQKNLKVNCYILFAYVVLIALGFAGLVVTGYHWTSGVAIGFLFGVGWSMVYDSIFIFIDYKHECKIKLIFDEAIAKEYARMHPRTVGDAVVMNLVNKKE